jgi:hypothetical protein
MIGGAYESLNGLSAKLPTSNLPGNFKTCISSNIGLAMNETVIITTL